MTILKLLKDRIEDAGAASEQASGRNGFLSYHAESHAVGVGAGIAWLALVTGNLQLLGAIVPAISAGLAAKDKQFSKILTDIYQEPHYALGGVVVGGVLGTGVRLALGAGLPL